MSALDSEFKSAFAALVGRPNCGKSTLLNAVVGEQLSIVTALPQTTRRRLRGIYNSSGIQIVFVDTPGIHRGTRALNKSMYAESARVLQDESIDIVCYLVDLSRAFGEEEDAIAHLAERASAVLCVVFNKIDLCEHYRDRRAEFMQRYPKLASCPNICISATAPSAKREFLDMLMPLVGPGPQYYPDDELTDADMRFLASEFIRKRTIEATREEVPHATCVEILSYKELPDKHDIDAVIHVETNGQKGIVIGDKGKKIKRIQQSAQQDIARFTAAPVSLRCHVRVSPKWRDNPRFLREMGLAGRD